MQSNNNPLGESEPPCSMRMTSVVASCWAKGPPYGVERDDSRSFTPPSPTRSGTHWSFYPPPLIRLFGPLLPASGEKEKARTLTSSNDPHGTTVQQGCCAGTVIGVGSGSWLKLLAMRVTPKVLLAMARFVAGGFQSTEHTVLSPLTSPR